MNSIDFTIATNIETRVFYSIIEFLKESGWTLTVEYDENIFDKGIDFDLYQFSKNNETILLAWNNWFEGEIKATEKTLDDIAEHFGIALKFEEPEYLQRQDIIEEMRKLLNFKK
jgi:hypothetical protein